MLVLTLPEGGGPVSGLRLLGKLSSIVYNGAVPAGANLWILQVHNVVVVQ